MKRIFTLLALVTLTLSVLAQSPDLMTYQAVLRDTEDHLLANQAVAIQISILQGAPNGTAVYTEVHSLSTNDNGLISLEIGDGATSDDLSTVDWSSGPYYIKTETDPAGGSNYTITSTTQLLSVPYAKYADEAGNAFSGNYGDLTGAPTNVSAFTNDAGYLTSQLWTPNGSDIYYSLGRVGIGTNSPNERLTINNGANNTYLNFQNNSTGTGGSNGFLVGVNYNSNAYIWNYEPGFLSVGTDNSTRLFITSAGDVGIGTVTPAARLDVNGSIKIGSNGVVINEIREVTGTTHATNDWISFELPSGYNETNTRVLSIEINYLGDRWMGLGFENADIDQNISYSINETTMYIYYPNSVDYLNSRAFRVIIMQIGS